MKRVYYCDDATFTVRLTASGYRRRLSVPALSSPCAKLSFTFFSESSRTLLRWDHFGVHIRVFRTKFSNSGSNVHAPCSFKFYQLRAHFGDQALRVKNQLGRKNENYFSRRWSYWWENFHKAYWYCYSRNGRSYRIRWTYESLCLRKSWGKRTLKSK